MMERMKQHESKLSLHQLTCVRTWSSLRGRGEACPQGLGLGMGPEVPFEEVTTRPWSGHLCQAEVSRRHLHNCSPVRCQLQRSRRAPARSQLRQ